MQVKLIRALVILFSALCQISETITEETTVSEIPDESQTTISTISDDPPNSKLQDGNLSETLNELNSSKEFPINGTLNLALGKKRPDLEAYEPPHHLRKNFPYYLSGYDDDGRPIWVAEAGKMNVRKYSVENNLHLLEKYAEQAAYNLLKSLGDRSTEDNVVTDAIFIADMDNFDHFQLADFGTVAFALRLAVRYRALMERHTNSFLLVNTNSVALTLLNIIRPSFGRVFEKMEIYGTQKAKFIPYILKRCPKDQIAPWYGGTKNFKPVRVYG